MPSLSNLIVKVALATALMILQTGCDKTKGANVREIKFELGKNIVETAKASGVPKFSSDEIAGLVNYSIQGVRPEIPARFVKPGYEVAWQPIFSFNMYADRSRDPEMKVNSVSLSLDRHITSHPEAQAFVEQTIAQFAKGKWKRFYDPVWEVLLTGRSSYLNEAGELDAQATGAADPAYKLSTVEWPIVANQGVRWYWIGDGVVATLHVHNMVGVDTNINYRMNLDFELYDNYKATLDRNENDQLKAGDAKGWGSTAKHEADKKNAAELNKRLVANAIKRGDRVVQE